MGSELSLHKSWFLCGSVGVVVTASASVSIAAGASGAARAVKTGMVMA